jgi:hypothetical protein
VTTTQMQADDSPMPAMALFDDDRGASAEMGPE